MNDEIECVIVGAGVVGLAIARALALGGREVIVLEKAETIGTETSSRNSEVIHAGIYYPKDSLKARLCVAGKSQLYEHCASHQVGHRNCGKLIVATSPDEAPILDEIALKAANNGVEDLYYLDPDAARELEPELVCSGALMSPSTGIIDSHALMLSYQGVAEDHGAMIAFKTEVLGGAVSNAGFKLQVLSDGQPMALKCRQLVNASGLAAPALAGRLDGMPAALLPPQKYCKGNYFSLAGKQPFQRLIYPVPASASLGVHVTVDLAGQTRFGPDQQWVDDVDYDVDPDRGEIFYEAVRRYWPALRNGQLQPSYAGIRPKIHGPGDAVPDFIIQGAEDHGISGLVNLFGIESPGLTASLAIGDLVAGMIRQQ